MSEEQSEQPRYVTQDQHRADMAELRGELKEEIAGLRHDIVGLTKTIEANQQTMMLRFEQAERQRAEDRQAMLQQFPDSPGFSGTAFEHHTASLPR